MISASWTGPGLATGARPGEEGLVRGAGPRSPGDLRRGGCERFEGGDEGRRAGIDGERRPVDAAKLLGAGMDVDERLARFGNVDQRIARGRHLAEPSADEEEDIGLLHPLGERRVDADADVAGIVRMVVVEEHLAAEGAADRQVEAFGEAAHARRPPPRSSASRRE